MCIACTTAGYNSIFLDYSDCPTIRTLPSPDTVPNLKFLAIYDTQIADVPNYPSLEALYMMGCPIKSLDNLPKLRRLNASGSELQTIPDNLFRLEWAKLDGCPLNTLPDTLISMQTLSINNCPNLTSISPKWINLETLSIASTGISFIWGYPNLSYLDITGLDVSELPLKRLPSLRKVVARECNLADPFAIIERGINLEN